MSATARRVALDVLDRIFFDQAYSHLALSAALDNSALDERDRGLVTELVYGTVTQKRTIDALLAKFVNRDLAGLDRPVLLSLRLATYQLLFLDRIPDHAAVDEAVELTKADCGRGASGFVNGVLRNMLRKRRQWNIWDTVDAQTDPARHLGLRHSLPDWLARRLIDAYGIEKARRLARAFNARPPYYFRAVGNDPDALIEKSSQLSPVDAVPGALRADHLSDQTRRLIEDNELVVQDLGSQLVGHLAQPATAASGSGDTLKILDACAGLGGKTLHLASLAPENTRIVAVDPQASKLKILRQSAQAQGPAADISTVEGTLAGLSSEHGPFDLILVDAPCTGLGVLRRHPETRWRRREEDIADRAALQAELLDQAATHLAPDGLLVYSVCTFSTEEGVDQIDAFLGRHDKFARAPLADPKSSATTPLDWTPFLTDGGDLMVNPADHDSDAFFAARLRRRH